VPDQRLMAVLERGEGESISELARSHGVSRKTIYKWLERYEEGGPEALADLSRRPHHSPGRVSAEVVAAIVAARLRWKWGPAKLRVKLVEAEPKRTWPGESTIAAILQARGLTVDRRRRRRTPPQRLPFAAAVAPNRVWCADFKGWFRTGDGTRVDPLTLSDAASRYLLRCQIVARPDTQHARAVLEAAFREYGLPEVLHTDNGEPFASVAPRGLSRLALWLVKLGIVPERSRVASPQDNGRHERLHLTLKQATAQPPQATVRLQQKAFDAFRREYNEQRPHAALGQRTPASCYVASARPYPRRVPEIEYPAEMLVRRVSQQGSIRWRGQRTYISEVFGHEPLGLKPADGRWFELYYGPLPIGWFDSHAQRFTRSMPRCLRPEP